jgi:5-methylcytosine-specific restriction endonuclease McrA
VSRTAEFSKPVKREAVKRAKGSCEAVGEWYGLEPGQRCGASLSHGLNFDHIILEANSHDNSLENCACVCIPCHRYKTAKRDTPLAAKTARQQDKAVGIRKSASMQGSRNSRWKKKMDGSVVAR